MNKFKFKYYGVSKGLFIFLFTVINFISNAQNVDEDLKQISLKCEGSDQLSLTQQVKYFESYTSKTPLETNVLVFKRDNQKVYSNAYGLETLINNEVMVIVDHNSKMIMLERNENDYSAPTLTSDINRIKKLSSNIEYKQTKQNACYTFHFSEGEQLKSEIWFNKTSYVLTKIVLYLREEVVIQSEADKSATKPRLELLFTELKTDCEFDENTFSVEQFLVNSEKGLKIATAYKDYKLINNIRY